MPCPSHHELGQQPFLNKPTPPPRPGTGSRARRCRTRRRCRHRPCRRCAAVEADVEVAARDRHVEVTEGGRIDPDEGLAGFAGGHVDVVDHGGLSETVDRAARMCSSFWIFRKRKPSRPVSVGMRVGQHAVGTQPGDGRRGGYPHDVAEHVVGVRAPSRGAARRRSPRPHPHRCALVAGSDRPWDCRPGT